jgi:hypothetical protein
MIAARQFFHLECDEQGCDARSPSVGYEVAAWDNPIDLINSAADEEWLIMNGTHWCPDHVVWCVRCEDVIVPYVIKVCDACLASKFQDQEGGSTQQGPNDRLANYRRDSHE